MNNNILNLLPQLKQNPVQFLAQYGLNIPQNINNPQDIIQHLLNTGQVSQNQVNQIQQLRNNPLFQGFFK